MPTGDSDRSYDNMAEVLDRVQRLLEAHFGDERLDRVQMTGHERPDHQSYVDVRFYFN